MQTPVNSSELFFLCLNESFPLSDVLFSILHQTILRVRESNDISHSHYHCTLNNISYAASVNEVFLLPDSACQNVPIFRASSYSAPEMKHNAGQEYNEKTAVYSLGVTFNFLIDFAEQVQGKKLIQDASIHRQVFDYMQRMISRLPHHRPTLAEACDFFAAIQSQKLSSADTYAPVSVTGFGLFSKSGQVGSWLRPSPELLIDMPRHAASGA
jgi:hypothetical protein